MCVLSELSIALCSYVRTGISLTVTGHILNPSKVTPAAIADRFQDFYAGEALVRVLKNEIPDVKTYGAQLYAAF